ncbi:Mitogen-activated protein kinase kinase kinase 7 [Balamuthia mandrillaris]
MLLAWRCSTRLSLLVALSLLLSACCCNGQYPDADYYWHPDPPTPGLPFNMIVTIPFDYDGSGYLVRFSDFIVRNQQPFNIYGEGWTVETVPGEGNSVASMNCGFSGNEELCWLSGTAGSQAVFNRTMHTPPDASGIKYGFVFDSDDTYRSNIAMGQPRYSLDATFSRVDELSPASSFVPGQAEQEFQFLAVVTNRGPSVQRSGACRLQVSPAGAATWVTPLPAGCAIEGDSGNSILKCSYYSVVDVDASLNVAEGVALIPHPSHRGGFQVELLECGGLIASETLSFEVVGSDTFSFSMDHVEMNLSVAIASKEGTAGKELQLGATINNQGPSSSLGTVCRWTLPKGVSLANDPQVMGCNITSSNGEEGSSQVQCNLDQPLNVLPGSRSIKLAVLLDASLLPEEEVTRMVAVECKDELGVWTERGEAPLIVNTLCNSLSISPLWLNPPSSSSSSNTKRQEEEEEEEEEEKPKEELEFMMEMKSGGPSWAEDVSCTMTFSHGTFLSSSATGSSSFVGPEFCSPLVQEEDLQQVRCVMGQLTTEVPKVFNFSLSVWAEEESFRMTMACNSSTTNSFEATDSLRAVVNVQTGELILLRPNQNFPDEGSSSNSEDDENKSGGGGGSGSDLTGVYVAVPLSVLALVVIVAVVVGFFLVRRKKQRRSLAMRERDLESSYEDGEELYGYKSDVIKNSTNKRGGKNEGGGRKERGGVQIAWEIPFDEMEFEKEIGKGAFGVVWKGSWRDSEVAIKQLLRLQSKSDVEAFQAEVELMKRLRPHANVVLLMGVCMEEGHPFCLVTEFLPRGDLRHFLRSKEGKLVAKDKKTLVRMAREIAAGMSHLHAEGITHRDLAARNLLLGKDLTIKVSDFGLALKQSKLKDGKFEEDTPMPLKWIAPECLESNQYSEKTDVWSYGVTLWELTNQGAEPYPGMSSVEAAVAVLKGHKLESTKADACPAVLQQVMEQCFATDPDERPTFSEIVKLLDRAK